MIHVYVTWNIVAGPDGLPGLPTRVQANHDDDDDDDSICNIYIYTSYNVQCTIYIYMYICICICRYCHQKMQISCATALSSHFSQTVLGSGRAFLHTASALQGNQRERRATWTTWNSGVAPEWDSQTSTAPAMTFQSFFNVWKIIYRCRFLMGRSTIHWWFAPRHVWLPAGIPIF